MSNNSTEYIDEFEGRMSVGHVITEVTSDNPADNNVSIDPKSVPVLPLRDIVMFPGVTIPVSVGREASLKLCKAAYHNELIAVFTQKDPSVEDPSATDLHRIGVTAQVLKVLELPDDTTTVILSPYVRVHLNSIGKRKPYLRGSITTAPEIVPEPNDEEMVALIFSVREAYTKILQNIPDGDSKEIRFALDNMENPLTLLNFMCVNSPISASIKQQLLETGDLKQRALELTKHLNVALQLTQLRADIQSRTREELTQQQREHFLQQQIRSIQDELGGSEDEQELDELRRRADEKAWPESVDAQFDKELRKLERFNPTSPDYAIQYTYIDTLLNLPWETYTKDNFTLKKVERVLNRDHYGLDKVKDRIIEQMAVLKMRKDLKASIICLYGPPGVGKTSLGKSVADAMGREYARISLGGVHDEAEIRGHRRTYIGAMPGRVISALLKTSTSNPVIVLDEIDKIGKDFKGDPSTALLEVLDPEQNSKFHDNYIDVDYDLSKVLFIATANDLSTISRPLLDRMEIIEISGYTAEEKVEIAIRHLVPKALENHGFEHKEISFTPEAVREIIDKYTRESGVRQLEKKIAKVLRRIARKKVSKTEFPKVVKPDMLRELLGPQEVFPDEYENNDYAGVVTGLAWTQAGGEILFIESSLSPGKGEKLTLTGNLGDVMKESAVIAMQYLKANADKLGIDFEKFGKNDVHVHVPEGAIPKDGPSAGVTMVTSLASSFTKRKVRPHLAMTGEITLRGKVLPVGGIKEKVLAAKRAGIKDIILCKANRKDIDDIKPEYLEGLTFHYVDRIEEVLDFALLDERVD